MKGILDYIHKKALKETYNAIFGLADDSEEKAKSLETPVSKEEIDDMRSRISAKYRPRRYKHDVPVHKKGTWKSRKEK